jgi:hypothetical protein
VINRNDDDWRDSKLAEMKHFFHVSEAKVTTQNVNNKSFVLFDFDETKRNARHVAGGQCTVHDQQEKNRKKMDFSCFFFLSSEHSK